MAPVRIAKASLILRAIYPALCGCLALLPGIVQAEDFSENAPFQTLGDSQFKVEVYVPDAVHGFYRGSRFDWSGMVRSLHCGTHQYFTSWQHTHEPEVNHGAGPAEEFDLSDSGEKAPPGFSDAASGDLFLKIGVGWLRKDNEAAYHSFDPYFVVDSGTWQILRAVNSLTFIQHVPSGRGYGYVYQKQISIDPAKHLLRISHKLKNSGEHPLDTRTYCHNFLRIDNLPPGAGYHISFNPELAPVDSSIGGLQRKGAGWDVIQADIPETKFIIPQDGKLKIKILNAQSQGTVEITPDQDLQALHLYSDKIAFCSEPFINIHLLPGQEATWSWQYVFQP